MPDKVYGNPSNKSQVSTAAKENGAIPVHPSRELSHRIHELQKTLGNKQVGILIQTDLLKSHDVINYNRQLNWLLNVAGHPVRTHQIQRQPAQALSPQPQNPPTPSAEPNPEEIWDRTEPDIIRELLIKLQEIGRAAAVQTRNQIDGVFSPYEDSLESDQTFLQVMSIPLGGGANAPQGGGTRAEIAGGLAGAAAAAAQLGMTKLLDFKSVGQVKARANSDISGEVSNLFTSNSDLYISPTLINLGIR